jgi:hypothetical protein
LLLRNNTNSKSQLLPSEKQQLKISMVAVRKTTTEKSQWLLLRKKTK